MWDDDRDKEMTRNQLFGVIAMTLLLVVWLTWFMPKRSQPPAEPAPQQAPAESPESQEVPAKPLEASVDMAVPKPEEGEGAAGQEEPAGLDLAPVPEQQTPGQFDEVLENGDLRLVFTRVGARLKKAYVILHQHRSDDEVQLVPEAEGGTDAESVYPLGLRFSDPGIADRLDQCLYEVARDEQAQSITFSVTIPGTAVVRKIFSFSDKPYVIDTRIEYENLRDRSVVLGQDQTPAYILNWGPNIDSPDKEKGVKQTLVWRQGETNNRLATRKMEPEEGQANFVKTMYDPRWVAVKSAYFFVAMKPEFEGPTMGWALGNPERFRWGIAAPRFEVDAAGTQTNRFLVYVGPSEMQALGAAWETLPTAYRFFESVTIMDWFAKLLLKILNFFYSIIPSYGIAIILLTVLVRVGMLPLTLKQMRSMKKMQMLAPELEEIKQKCGDDQQEFQKKMMALYKERGVNPLGGCLPLLLQLPVFISLYRMLWSAFELRGAPFTILKYGDFHWISDLSEPDRLLPLPFLASIPWIGEHFEYLNVLPILGAIAMVLSTKLAPTQGPVQNPQQKMMMTFMPLFFGVVCYNFAAGLNLYILTGSVIQILQSKLMPVGHVDVDEKKPVRKKQHFYTAAQARKRQLSKEQKEGAKRNPSSRPASQDSGARKSKKKRKK